MAGYADTCSLCGNNKRRRFGHGSRSRSDDGTLPCSPLLSLPPTLRPKSKSDPTPLPSPPTAEIVITRAEAKKPTSPPAATASGSVETAAPAAGVAVPALSLPNAPLWSRPGVTSIISPESRGDSNIALPPTLHVKAVRAAATARALSSPEASGSRRRLGTDADESGEEEEGANSDKKGERAPAAKEVSEEEDMEEAAMRIRCTCGRVQEFVHRQKRTTT